MYFQKKLDCGWCACDGCASPGTVRANVSGITISYNYLLCAGGNFPLFDEGVGCQSPRSPSVRNNGEARSKGTWLLAHDLRHAKKFA